MATTDTVVITATDSDGNTGSATATITVYDVPTVEIVGIPQYVPAGTYNGTLSVSVDSALTVGSVSVSYEAPGAPAITVGPAPDYAFSISGGSGGTYALDVEVHDSTGYGAGASQELIGLEQPAVTFGDNLGNDTGYTYVGQEIDVPVGVTVDPSLSVVSVTGTVNGEALAAPTTQPNSNLPGGVQYTFTVTG